MVKVCVGLGCGSDGGCVGMIIFGFVNLVIG